MQYNHSFLHSFYKYLLMAYYIPGAVLSVKNIAENMVLAFTTLQ